MPSPAPTKERTMPHDVEHPLGGRHRDELGEQPAEEADRTQPRRRDVQDHDEPEDEGEHSDREHRQAQGVLEAMRPAVGVEREPARRACDGIQDVWHWRHPLLLSSTCGFPRGTGHNRRPGSLDRPRLLRTRVFFLLSRQVVVAAESRGGWIPHASIRDDGHPRPVPR